MAEFTSAVEQKQVAQQDAERARYLVEKVCSLYLPSHLTDSCSFIIDFFSCPLGSMSHYFSVVEF